MRLVYFISFVIVLTSCNKDKFDKTTIFLEEFNDNSKGWKSSPYESILTAPNECMKIESGQLKLHFERGFGLLNCGGGWVAAELSDSLLDDKFAYHHIGVKIVMNSGYLQNLWQKDTIYPGGGVTYSHALVTSHFDIAFGGYRFSPFLPSDLDTGSVQNIFFSRYYASEIVMIANSKNTNNKLFLDKIQIGNESNQIANVNRWYVNAGLNYFPFLASFKIGYGTELTPYEMDMLIESIEIFTWEGEFDIDKI